MLATRLPQRTGRSVSLTDDGIIYLERVRRAGLAQQQDETVGRPDQISDLNDKPFLCYSPYGTDGRLRYEEGNRIVDLQFKPVFRSDHEQLLLQCARKAMGFIFLARHLGGGGIL
ncbi:hypothetical protein [Rhizobium sp. FKY42]|uniref:hypothetical protein n=1 Tax=Rhizobium sp. FKY42 TaxID=2562310 RepID=UPI0010C06C21|nr:hypothetical protein [Rhizobium sp. FKY42]